MVTVYLLWRRPTWMGDVVLVGVFATEASASLAAMGWAANTFGIEPHVVLT